MRKDQKTQRCLVNVGIPVSKVNINDDSDDFNPVFLTT